MEKELEKRISKETLKKIIKVSICIIWMIVVFLFSNEISDDSTNTSGNTIKFFLELVKHDWTEQELKATIKILQPFARKLAHFTLYAIGGFIIFGLTRLSKKIEELNQKNKYINTFTITVLIGMIYSITDEIHQMFVPGRAGRIFDVCVDTLGIAFGCFLHIILRKIIENIKK